MALVIGQKLRQIQAPRKARRAASRLVGIGVFGCRAVAQAFDHVARRLRGEFAAALAVLQRQLEIFERLQDREWIGRAHFQIGTTLGALGRCQEAIPHLEQANDAAEAGSQASACRSRPRRPSTSPTGRAGSRR